MKDHSSINKIDLRGICGEEIDGYGMLCSIMAAGANKLKSIDLSRNDIRTEGSTFIADFLATNPILEKLVLWGNKLDDNDANSIANALKHNTNLRILDIYPSGDITDAGWDLFLKAEFDSTSLNSAAESNHTFYIDRISKFNGDSETEDNFGQAAVQQKKIYHILSARQDRQCSNIQHFDDVPIEFLPDMLSSIQQYSGTILVKMHRPNMIKMFKLFPLCMK